MSESDADSVIEATRQRLLAIVDHPPYRYVDTSSGDRAAYEAQKRSFTDYSDATASGLRPLDLPDESTDEA